MKRYIDFVDNSATGNAVAGASIQVVDYSTNSAVTIYSDDGSTVIAGSTVTTDADGMFAFYAPAGRYTLRVSVAGTLVKTIEDVQIPGGAAESVTKVATIAALTALATASLEDGQVVAVSGYYSAGDGGGGEFYWDSASSATDNGGTIIAPDAGGTGRWRALGEMTAKRWGIKGDGTTDDTTKIQAAFNAMTSGGPLKFTQGTYKGTAEITVPYAITIVGDGRDATLFNFTTLGTNKSAFKATADGVHFRDFKLTGPSSASYVAEETGIRFYATSAAEKEGGSVRNVEVNNFGAYGIQAEYYNKVSVTDSYVHDVGYMGIASISADDFVVRGNTVSTITPGTSGNAYGIAATNRASGAVPVRFVFDGNTVDDVTIWEGIDTHGGTDGVISNNTITNCKIGINVSPGDTNEPPHRVSVTGNTINKGSGVTTPQRGIALIGYNGANKSEGLVAAGNVINDMGVASDYTDGAILLKFTKGAVVTGNSIIDPVATGIGLYDSNTDFVVSGNSVAIVQAGHANASGIVVNAASQSGAIVGNFIEAVANQFGIFMVSASADVVAFDNKIITSGTGGPYVGAPSGAVITASATYDPPNLVDGAGATTTVTVGQIALGDYATASFSLDLQGITVTAWVTDTSTVSVRFQNETGGAIDLASGTLRVRVRKA